MESALVCTVVLLRGYNKGKQKPREPIMSQKRVMTQFFLIWPISEEKVTIAFSLAKGRKL